MAEYIERDKVLAEIDERISNLSFTSPYQSEIESIVDGMERARDSVVDAPAADVAPVVHGRWIPIKVPTGIELLGIKEMVVGFIRCSKCYMEFDISCEWYSHYCPNCGARMDGDKE